MDGKMEATRPEVIEDTRCLLRTIGKSGQLNSYYRGVGPTLNLLLQTAQICAYASDTSSHLKEPSELSKLARQIEARAKIHCYESLCLIDRPTVSTQELKVIIVAPSDAQRADLTDWELKRNRIPPSTNAAIIEFQEQSDSYPALWLVTCWLSIDELDYLIRCIELNAKPTIGIGISSIDLYSDSVAPDIDNNEVMYLRPSSFESAQSVGKISYITVKFAEITCETGI